MRSACSTVFLVVCGLNALGTGLLSCGSSTSDAAAGAGLEERVKAALRTLLRD